MGLVEVSVLPSAAVDARMRRRLHELWDRAFAGRFDHDDADHAFGGVHVVAVDDGRLVGHASAVERRIRFGDAPWQTVGYVEGVAVEPERQREGVGRRTMLALHDEIAARWPAAMLSTGRATSFYESLGWERWRGLSFTRTAAGIVPDGEHGGLMILRVDHAAVPDLAVDVTCEDRLGDAW